MQELFKKALSSFATGVCIVSYKTEYGYNGLTISAFSSLSLDPAKILFCIKNSGLCYQELLKSNKFTVSILSSEQKELAYTFASKDLKLDNNQIEIINNVPIIKDSIATIFCKRGSFYPEGDHDIVIGNVESIEISKDNKSPLLYFRSNIIDNYL